MNKLKSFAINKVVVSTICLLLFGLFYFYPTHEEIKTEVNDEENKTINVIYMLDKDNYVSRVTTFFDSKNIEDEIRNKINILTNGSNELYDFYPLIPKNTKLNSVKVNKNEVTLDFSKELYSVSKYLEESMVEAILYTITEINGIDTLYINVDGIPLRNLPNSHMDIPYPLKRSYGINKEYNLNSLNDISKTQNDLNSYFDMKTKLIDYQIKDNKIELKFNEYIFKNEETQEEEKFILTNSIFENYDINEININDKYVFKRY